jgi:hypothetical protein
MVGYSNKERRNRSYAFEEGYKECRDTIKKETEYLYGYKMDYLEGMQKALDEEIHKAKMDKMRELLVPNKKYR